MFKMTIEGEGVKTIESFLAGAFAAQSDLEIPSAMIRVFGLFTQNNYRKRGQEFGEQWQNISKYSQGVRRDRGQNVVAPPLFGGGESGWLYRTSATALADWPRESPGRSFVDNGKYSSGKHSDGPTAMQVTATPEGAVIKMQGAKAAHMTGDTSGAFIGFAQYRPGGYGASSPNRYGGGFLPARPFWGLNMRMMDVMGDAVVSAYIRNWADRAEKMGSGRVFYSAESFAALRWKAI